MSTEKPVRMKIYPNADMTRSVNRCGACGAVVPDRVTHCRACGVPIYGRTGPGSFTKCQRCGGYIPDGAEKCPNCRAPI